MIPLDKVRELISSYENLEKELSSGEINKKNFAEKSKEYSDLKDIIIEAKEYLSFEKEKKELEKIILCDVQIEIYSDLEKSLLDLLHNSGYPGIKFEKKVDFKKLYNQRFN